MQEIIEKIVLPRPEEKVAIAIGREKTAAMCYDRVWSPSTKWRSPHTSIPDDIRFYCGTAPEHAMLKNLYRKEPLIHKILLELKQLNSVELKSILLLAEWNSELLKNAIPELSVDQLTQKILNSLSDEERDKISSDFMDWIESTASGFLHLPGWPQIDEDFLFKLVNEKKYDDVFKYALGESYVQREITKSMAETYDIHITNIYDSENARKNEFAEGDRHVIVASLEGLGIIDNFALTWEQILDFRKDANARRKYIRFLHWLDKDMIGKSPAYIQDEISIRLEDYERSLKKHGIKTVIGTVSEVLDGKYILGTSGVTAGMSLSGHPILGLLAGIGLLIGKVAVKISEAALSFDDKELGSNSEVSWVYEVKKLQKRHL